MSIQTCPEPDRILAFVLGKLPDGEAETIAGHLEECTVCDGTAASLECRCDAFVAEMKRPTGDSALVSETDFRRAAELIAAIGHEPTDVGVNRRAAAGQSQSNTLGQYQLLEKLGEGGMGTVYKALHKRLEKVVAVKVLSPQRLRDPAAVARFDREMKAVGKLEHPNIVRAMDAGEADGMHYLVMEYVEGIDLARLVKRRGPLPIAEACELVRQAAIGLEEAHRHGMVHRDIKPGNLMLAAEGSGLRVRGSDQSAIPGTFRVPQSAIVKILDLGLALLADPNDPHSRELTSSGQVMGTIDFMAPEQGAQSHAVDARADVYSLGATLYKLLTGKAIYEGEQFSSPMQKMVALATEPAPPIRQRRADVPEGLAHIVHKMIAKRPEDRFATAADVAAALAPWGAGANLAALVDPSIKLSSGPMPITRPPDRVVVSSPAAARRSSAGDARRSQQARLLAATVAAGVIGVIFLAAIFLLRTPQGTITVEVDPAHQKDVTLVVTGGGEQIEVSDKSGWQLKVRAGEYHFDVRDSGDRFEVSKDDVVVRRGENTIVRVTRKPPPPGETHVGSRIDPLLFAGNAGEDVIHWLAENNAMGPESDLIQDARTNLLGQSGNVPSFSYRLSAKLLKSGRHTEVVALGPHWFAHELTGAQAEMLTLNDKPVAGFRKGPTAVGRWARATEFRLISLELDNEDALGKDGRIQGWLSFERSRPGQPKSHYFARMVFMHDGPITLAQGIAGDPSGEGKIRLQLANPLPKQWEAGAMAIFVDVGKFAEGKEQSSDFNDFIALSDPLSRMITLHQAESP